MRLWRVRMTRVKKYSRSSGEDWKGENGDSEDAEVDEDEDD